MDSRVLDASSYLHLAPNRSAEYVYPAVERALRAANSKRVFEIGCGTGDIAARLVKQGIDVFATDPSKDAIRQAQTKYPGLAFELASAYDNLACYYGGWDAVIAVEVIEHLYSPKYLASCAYDLLSEGGVFVLTTPFHGYWKNLALSLAGRWDSHSCQ